MAVFTLTSGIDILIGTATNDTFIISLVANFGVDDFLTGGAGIDTLQFTSAVIATLDLQDRVEEIEIVTLTGTAALNLDASDIVNALTINGNSAANILTGTFFDDTLRGNAGKDTLNGGNGNDTIIGGAGKDTLNGGIGDDVFRIATPTDHGALEIINGGANTDTIRFTSITAGQTLTLNALLSNVEEVEISDSSGNNSGNIALNLNATAVTGNLNLTGNAGNNILTGGAGVNTITANAGNDTLKGGAGMDVLNGGAGADILKGGAGNDIILIDSATDFATGETIDGGANTDTIRFTSLTAGQTLTLTADVTTIENVVIGTAAGVTSGTIALNVNAALVTTGLSITGNNGNNSLTGTAMADTINGNAGNDILKGGTGNDILNGDNNDDFLRGGPGNDTLNGGGEADRLEGDEGNDTLAGGAGNDTLTGGDDSDTADYSGAAAGVTVNLGTNSTSDDGDGGSDTLSGIENVTGSANDDSLTGDVNANVLNGGAGNDTLNGGIGNDVLNGGIGDDVLDGGIGDDVLDGEDGSDTYVLNASAIPPNVSAISPSDDGSIYSNGSVSNTAYLYATASIQGVVEFPLADLGDKINTVLLSVNPYGLPLRDQTVEVYGYQSSDGVLTSADHDAGTFLGILTLPNNLGYGQDAFFDVTDFVTSATTAYVGFNLHTTDSDVFSSLEYNYGHPAQLVVQYVPDVDTYHDTGNGEGDIDTLDVSQLTEVQLGDFSLLGNGVEVIAGAAQGTVLVGDVAGVEWDFSGMTLENISLLQGTNAADTITGSAAGDNVQGGGGNDTLNGGSGNDTLAGGAGNDTLTGGGDNDIFLFNDTLDVSNVDTIMDFAGAGTTALDVIHLDDAIFTALLAGTLDPENFVSGVAPSAVEADDYILYDTSTGELFYDADGSDTGSDPELFAVIASDVDYLSATDFVVF